MLSDWPAAAFDQTEPAFDRNSVTVPPTTTHSPLGMHETELSEGCSEAGVTETVVVDVPDEEVPGTLTSLA